jgi:uncharacterized RmlC-like cupin family protein
MLRVSKVEGWLARPRGTGPARRPDQRATGDCLIIRSRRVGDGRRGSTSQRPDGSGPPSGSPALRLHLVLIPPGTRGTPQAHSSPETAFVYQVSGEAEVWHGAGLANRATARAGDVVCIPPGTPHLTVNRGDVTSVAVVARVDPPDAANAVVIELPEHLADLRHVPVECDA